MSGEILGNLAKKLGTERFVVVLAHLTQGAWRRNNNEPLDLSTEHTLVEQLHNACLKAFRAGLALIWIAGAVLERAAPLSIVVHLRVLGRGESQFTFVTGVAEQVQLLAISDRDHRTLG